MTVAQKRRPTITEADVAWTEERAIGLMHAGLPFAEAVELAARECSLRVVEQSEKRQRAFEEAVWEMARLRSEERVKREAAERKQRNEQLEAQACQAQAPTLKATLGDLIAAKGRVGT